MRSLLLLAGFVLCFATVPQAAQAQSFVELCAHYGIGYFYIPGTDTCVNANTGETREDSSSGTIRGVTKQQQQILDNAAQIKRNTEGVALSLALPNATVDPGKTFGAAVNVGAFDGQVAVGVGGAFRPTDGVTLNGAVGYGLSQGSVGGRAGVNLSW